MKTEMEAASYGAVFQILKVDNVIKGKEAEFTKTLEDSGILQDFHLQYVSQATLTKLADMLTEVQRATFLGTLRAYINTKAAATLQTEMEAASYGAAFKILKVENVIKGSERYFAKSLQESGILQDFHIQLVSRATLVNLAVILTEAQRARFVHTLNLIPEEVEVAKIAAIAAVTRQLTFASHGDTNGVLHFIGSQGGTAPYANPHEAGAVVASGSGFSSGSAKDIVARVNSQCYSLDPAAASSWFKFDMGPDRSLIPNHYTFKDGTSCGSVAIRNWRLEGSNDDATWVALRTHSNDTIINAGFAVGSWPITENQGAFRYFRVILTGKDKSQNPGNYLSLCCLELYGKYSWGLGESC